MKETRAEKNYVSEVAFRRWVEAMCEQFHENNEAILYNGRRGYTYVYLRSKVGFSKCAPNDKWNSIIGTAYAWARCTGQPEYYMEEVNYVPTPGDRVNVKFINSKIYPWIFVAEGVDNYCFRWGDGHLECYYKDRIKSITEAR